MTATIPTRPHPGLLDWLLIHRVDYEVHEHPETFTAVATADAEGVDPATFAKVVGVITADGRRALVVLDAPDRLDLAKARSVLGADDVRLLSEAELSASTPSCEVGATPAVGALFGLPMYADHRVGNDPEISFNAGTHRHSVRLDREAWDRATGVRYADLAVARDERPAWASE